VFVAKAVYVFAVQCGSEGVIARGNGALMDLVRIRRVLDLESCELSTPFHFDSDSLYPEINVQISTPTKLPVPNLESDGHLVVCVKLLMEAFSRVRLELDVVRER
jgi:hypothetical protein